MTVTTDRLERLREGLGRSVKRPDGVPKVDGSFAFSSDLQADGMVWGHILRSPHPHARIRSIDIGPALAVPGVHAVLTADDVPGERTYGLEHADQPVFAHDVVMHIGEPIAAVAADHPDTARRAARAIVVDYEELEPLVDAEAAITAAPIHPDGNVFAEMVIRHGDPSAEGEVVVEGTYEVGMQDQAFMGPESGLAVPDGEGGVDLHMSTQWLHVDRDQVANCLGVGHDKVRMTLAGVGGAFGAREDVSMQVHLCLLALHTGRPVKMVFTREESFLGHVHRHPARMHYRHHADRDGRLVKVEARIVLDGGAYASTSRPVLVNACCFAAGPYDVLEELRAKRRAPRQSRHWRNRTEVREQPELRAEPEQRLLGPDCRVDGVPLGAAAGTEKHGIGRGARGNVLVADRDAVGIDRGAADEPLLPLDVEVEPFPDGVDDAAPRPDDVAPDPISRNCNNSICPRH